MKDEPVAPGQEILFSTLAQSSPDCIKLFDLEGNLLFMSDGGLSEHGYSSVEEAQKRGMIRTLVPESQKIFKESFAAATRGEHSSIEVEHTKEGSNREFCLETMTPILNSKGEISGVLSISRDITRRKKEEEQLKELDKLKDDFLMVTTHELKTPLIPIKSQSQLLLAGDYGELNPGQRAAVDMILRNEENLNILASDVLDIAKIKSNKLKLVLGGVDISDLVTKSVKDMEAAASERHISLSLLPIEKMPNILVDESRIRQVMFNLLSNAIKFTTEHGTISVEVHKKDGTIEVSVKDSGIGISKDTLPKLFTPFFRAEGEVMRKYRGTGLGLAISKGIIEAHGGTIRVESEGEGKGSVFVFTIPTIVIQGT